MNKRYLFFQNWLVLLFIFSATTIAQTSQDIWNGYALDPNNHTNIPNCSYAGYHGGISEIPAIQQVANVKDFGAVGDGTTDDSEAFWNAINKVGLNGGGAIYVPQGTYLINKVVQLRKSGVVIRGAGKGLTTIKFGKSLTDLCGANYGGATSKWNWAGGLFWIGPDNFKGIPQISSYIPQLPAGYSNVVGHEWEYWHAGSEITAVTSTGERGTNTLTLSDATQLKQGQYIILSYENTADQALFKEICNHALFATWTNWGSWLTNLAGFPRWQWVVQIKSVSGNTVTLMQPLRVAAKQAFNCKIYQVGNIVQECGVENLSLQLNGPLTFNNNSCVGWNAIYMNRAINCWVKDVEIKNAENGILVSAGKNLSIKNVSIVGDGMMHHLINNRCESHDCLYDNFTIALTGDELGGTHGISTEWLSTGNVWSRGNMNQGTFDSHRAMSFDYIRTDITMKNNAKSGPGGSDKAGPFTARRVVHWNIKIQNSDRAEPGEYVYQPDNFVNGALVGISGAPKTDKPCWGGQNACMPWGDKNVLIADDQQIPAITNLWDAQLTLRKSVENNIELTAPALGVVPVGNVNLMASANAAQGQTITAVKFYANNNLIGSDNTNPYTLSWNAAAGAYDIKVELVGTGNAVLVSNTKKVYVATPTQVDDTDANIEYLYGNWGTNATDVNKAYCWNNTNHQTSGNAAFQYTFKGVSCDYYSSFQNGESIMDIYLDGVLVVSQKRLYENAEYQRLFWSSGFLADADHTVKFVTTGPYNSNVDFFQILKTGTSSGNQAPACSLTSPTNNASYTAPASILLTATATDNDGTIARVEFYNGINKLGEDLTAPYTFQWNGVTANTYSVYAKAIDNSGASTAAAAISITVKNNVVVNNLVQINFQPSTTVVPNGFLADTGAVYANRGNGFNYGWDTDISLYTRDRLVAGVATELNTLIHLQKNATPNTWEIGLANGLYDVTIMAGEPMYTDMINSFNVETVEVNDPDGQDQYDAFVIPAVAVNDGRLTISPTPSAVNSKICYILIAPSASNVVNNIANKNGDISIYPNPFSGKTTLNYLMNEEATVLIFDLVGKVVFSKKLNGASIETIDLTGKSKGMYVLKVASGETVFSNKIILE